MEAQEQIQQAFNALRRHCLRRCESQERYDTVLKAFEFMNDAYRGLLRKPEEPMALHPIELAKVVVADIGLGFKSIVTALLHDLPENSEYSVEDIQGLFGEKIASMVGGVIRTNRIFAFNREDINKHFREMLLTLNDDARILIIKLADVLLQLRQPDLGSEKQRSRILSQAMYIFVPLAHRLGLYSIKTEMENIWMRHMMPYEYETILGRIEQKMQKNQEAVNDLFIHPIQQALRTAGFRFSIAQRVKSPFSVWNKMQKRQVPFEQIFDIFAIRIIFYPNTLEEENAQCFQIESLINHLFPHNPERRREWITQPRETGYQALHSTYLGPTGEWVEVQIRSKRMDEIAEQGVAAHWKYKSGGEGEANSKALSAMEQWILQVRATLENQDVQALDFFDRFHASSLTPEIYVFTPRGEPRSLPKEATALDFAFSIHTKVGEKALAAKVNQKLVPLSHELHSGDQVEIITAESQRPKIEWLHFLKTAKARNHVGDCLRSEVERNQQAGQELLRARLKALGIQLQTRVLRKLCDHYGVNTKELYLRIGSGSISLDRLEETLQANTRVKMVRYWRIRQEASERDRWPQLPVHMAPCCLPLPGKKVVGVPEPGRCLWVHAADCPRLNTPGGAPTSLQPLDWEKYVAKSFLIRLQFAAKERVGILHDIDNLLVRNLHVNVRQLHINTHDGINDGYVDFYLQDTAALPGILRDLGALSGMISVTKEEQA